MSVNFASDIEGSVGDNSGGDCFLTVGVVKLVACVRNLPTLLVNVVLPVQNGGIFREELVPLPRSWRQQYSPQQQVNFYHTPRCYIREGSRVHVNRQDIRERVPCREYLSEKY